MAKLMIKRILIILLSFFIMIPSLSKEKRGVVVYPSDIISIGIDGWKQRITESGINLIGIHAATFNEPLDTLKEFVQSPLGQEFLKMCKKMKVDVEYELHVLQLILPRSEFDLHPEYFRQGQSGNRNRMYNMCFTNEDAYAVIKTQIADLMSWMRPTTHRYFLWPDDVKGTFCHCSECSGYSPSEQALIYENRILEMIREYDPKATLAHLAYNQTMPAPVKVKPADGIFLEFAPINRDYTLPVSAELKSRLEDNLKVFPASTAHILEYWLDESMFSSWKRSDLVPLPFSEQDCRRDINFYRNYGIKSITTFATWLGASYQSKYSSALWAFKGYGKAFSNGKAEESFRIRRRPHTIIGFHAPWSGKSDDTRLTMSRDADSLYFTFSVSESSFAVLPTISTKRDIELEDRVELFFSPTPDMSRPYYGVEIDPRGRVLDYKAAYYRDFDYEWSFPGISVSTFENIDSYVVRISFSVEDLARLGIGRRFWLGAFRADFDADGNVVWYSRRKTEDIIPDFHKPDILIPVII